MISSHSIKYFLCPYFSNVLSYLPIILAFVRLCHSKLVYIIRQVNDPTICKKSLIN